MRSERAFSVIKDNHVNPDVGQLGSSQCFVIKRFSLKAKVKKFGNMYK